MTASTFIPAIPIVVSLTIASFAYRAGTKHEFDRNHATNEYDFRKALRKMETSAYVVIWSLIFGVLGFWISLPL